MTGVSLSRWTMAYFAAALFFLLAAEGLMAVGFGFPQASLQAPETLILVHVVAIGWLSLLMCGALFQFLPVLVAQPLHDNRSPAAALALLICGLVALILGFLQLDGKIAPRPPLLPIGGALLGAGFAMAVWNLARTLWAAPTRPLSSRFVGAGLVSLVAAAALGIVFTLVLGGAATYGPMLLLTPTALPLHLVAGLGGWLTFAAMGVSYRLLAMFMLAPELDRLSTRLALSLGAAALAVAIVGGVVAILLEGPLALVLLAAGGLGLAALTAYGWDVRYLYRARKRPKIELNSRMAALAFASLAAAVGLALALLALGRLTDHLGAVVFLSAFGWLTGLGLSQLYKIVAFLTWLECYGPVLGKAPTPRVQDLVVEARAVKWFGLYFLAVWIGAAALLLGQGRAFQASAVAMLVATAGLIAQLVRTRRLADVAPAVRLPQGVRRPGLLVPLSRQA
jgi:hypothetical protein